MTDTSFSPFSNNPANNDSLSGVLRLVLRKWTQYLDDMMPAQVIAYDRTTNRAQVQPLIIAVTTTGLNITRAQVASVPVLQPGGGGFFSGFPINTGDLGWLKANDRDISLFKQGYQSAPPNTKRQHSFEDALFIPDIMTGYTIAAEDASNAVWQNKAGSVCISLWSSQIKATAPNMGITDTRSYAPNPNAVLDVQSTTKAFKIPRMTHAQRNAIPSPEGGFMVYVTDTPTGFSFYTDGVGWS